MRSLDPSSSNARRHLRHARSVCLALFAALSLVVNARADDEQRTARLPLLPKYQQECAACHLAYPPGMLPPASWERLMKNLPRHFGTDASLDPAALAELAGWLGAHGGTFRKLRETPPEDRITMSTWFVREHRRVTAEVWKRPAVGSASNCSACHSTAAEGRFSERDIRIPR